MAKSRRKRTAKPKPPVEETQPKWAPGDEPIAVNPSPSADAAQEPQVVGPFGSVERKEIDMSQLPSKVNVPANGTLIRGDGGPVVYVMQSGLKRPLRDALVFAACGFGWNEIKLLSPEEIDRIPTGKLVARQSDLQGRGA